MRKQANLWSFYFILVCLGLASYKLYSNLNNTWLVAPPNYILLLLSVTTLILSITGLQDRQKMRDKLRGWLTILLSSLTCIGIMLVLSFTSMFSIGTEEYIKTVNSPNNSHTIDFYHFDAGAAGSFGIRGERKGPLWFKKRMYYEENVEQVEVEWLGNDRIVINDHHLNLSEHDTYGYRK
ncbi:membrane protein [Gracilibacillus halophilus YIM-C55.5]|uniref:Membrane protein n=1 Tax=Gracilibacillus halophilus YIM-C55.5 TaxID=1308866 RepID=N4WY52_9BACI|nr:DUF5412 family protein [Gracilibacillus halophilus]ENH97986.1 membrane protein [Gracilibacillus halophilus YIM-C55.5]